MKPHVVAALATIGLIAGEPAAPATTAIEATLVYARGGATPGLFVVGVTTQKSHRLTRGHDTAPAWSPDGRRIAVEHHLSNGGTNIDVLLVRRDENRFVVLNRTRLVRNGRDPSWSHSGRKLAFVRPAGLFVLNLKMRSTINVVRIPFANSPSWAPNDRELVFDVAGSGLFTVPTAQSATPTTLTSNDNDADPSWSKKGAILFSRFDANPDRARALIYSIPSPRTEPLLLVGDTGVNKQPSWFTDSRQFAFVRSTSSPDPKAMRSSSEIYIYANRRLKRLTFNQVEDEEPSWRP